MIGEYNIEILSNIQLAVLYHKYNPYDLMIVYCDYDIIGEYNIEILSNIQLVVLYHK